MDWSAAFAAKSSQVRQSARLGLRLLGLGRYSSIQESNHLEWKSHYQSIESDTTEPQGYKMKEEILIPDEGLPPALAARLVGNHVSYLTYAVGTIFDLAQRGILLIRQVNSSRFMVELKTTSTSLRLHEQGLLQALFPQGARQLNLLDLRLLPSRFNELLEQELLELKLIDPQKKLLQKEILNKRSKSFRLKILPYALTISIALTFFLSSQHESHLLGLTLASLITALIFWFFWNVKYYANPDKFINSTLTPTGESQSNNWIIFFQKIDDLSLTRKKEYIYNPDVFIHLLPYAACHGKAIMWAHAFKKHFRSPSWFIPLPKKDAFGVFLSMLSEAYDMPI